MQCDLFFLVYTLFCSNPSDWLLFGHMKQYLNTGITTGCIKKGNQTFDNLAQYLMYGNNFFTVGNTRCLAFECCIFGKI